MWRKPDSPALPLNTVFSHDTLMKIPMIGALVLVFTAPAFAGDATPGAQSQPSTQIQPQSQTQPQQKPAGDMDRLLRELRDLDSSQEREGDHAVGEHLC